MAKNCALYVSKNCAVLLAEKCVLYLTIYRCRLARKAYTSSRTGKLPQFATKKYCRLICGLAYFGIRYTKLRKFKKR